MKRMPEVKPLPDLTLGTSLPKRLLNVFPPAWKRNHLIRESGGEKEPESFGFAETLQGARRLLLAWPTDPIEILAAYPAARALASALPEGTEFANLCEASNAALVQGLFPGPVLEWKTSTVAWHDASVRALVGDLRVFAPEVVLVLSQTRYPAVLQAALRATGARVRLGWEGATESPFVNVMLKPDRAMPLAARFFRALDLWSYAGFATGRHWTYLAPDTGRHESAVREWEAKRAAPETTWLFVQDASRVEALDGDLYEELARRVSLRGEERFTLGAVLWNPGMKPVSRQGAWLDAPVFNETDYSAFLAALDGARGVVGFHSFALHFATLLETRVLALLDPSESPHDVTGMNPLFEVDWV
jgi:ADP-heptose:LPS heptosyltransferase